VLGASKFAIKANTNEESTGCQVEFTLTLDTASSGGYELQVIVLASAIPGTPQVGEKGFSVLGGRPETEGDDANDPMQYLSLGAIEYIATNTISVDTKWDIVTTPLPIIKKGLTSYNEYTWTLTHLWTSERFWWRYDAYAKATIFATRSGRDHKASATAGTYGFHYANAPMAGFDKFGKRINFSGCKQTSTSGGIGELVSLFTGLLTLSFYI
jgi:hypothetical protein